MSLRSILSSASPLLRPVLTVACILTLFTACKKNSFHIEGTISGAPDSVLVLERMAIDGPQRVSEVTLDADGQFSFEGQRPDAPEFYRLRIAGEAINLSIDSTETVSVSASFPGMATRYEVKGSDNCVKIRELTLMQLDLEQRANAIMRSPALGIHAAEDSIDKVVEQYKQKVTSQYIFREPMKAYAYFALFQTLRIGNSMLTVFNPQRNADDIKVFGAVATTWDSYYPHSLRTQNLHNITIEGMKDVNVQKQRAKEVAIEAQSVGEASLIDLNLADNRGRQRTLSGLKGKVVLLDFHAFNTPESPKRIMQLRTLYDKYHAQGLEIYQVSLDKDLHFWKTQTAALPWICVHDDGSHTQAYLAVVQALPADFIIGRDNTVVKGANDIKNLEQDVAAAMH